MFTLVLTALAVLLTALAVWLEHAGYGRDPEAWRLRRLNRDIAPRRWWLAAIARRVRE